MAQYGSIVMRGFDITKESDGFLKMYVLWFPLSCDITFVSTAASKQQ